MEISSPWLIFPQQFHDFCGRDVGGWVRFPAPSWSSLFFCFVGIVIYFLANKQKSTYLKWWGIVVIFNGVMSFANHATGTKLGGILDLSNMFVFAWMLLIPLLWRSGVWKVKNYWAVIVLGSSLSALLNAINLDWGDPIFFSTIAIELILIVKIHFSERAKKINKFLIGAILSFLAAFGFALMDKMRILCFPDNHIFQGMAAWHLLGSVAILMLYFYLSRFKMPEWEKGV